MIQTERPPIYTIGHSTRTVAELVALLQLGSVTLLVDIRKIPRSRTNPQFNGETLPEALSPWQIGYVRIDELGGRRTKSDAVPPEANAYWQNRSFHNYADYALSGAFCAGMAQLEQLGADRRLAIMCSEAVWWRCHRRFVADYLIHRGHRVFHLMDPMRADAATMTPAARAAGDSLVYPADQPEP